MKKPSVCANPLLRESGLSRRNFFNLLGASLALGGMVSCRRPEDKIVPHVRPPRDFIPGAPYDYATTLPSGIDPVGLLVRTVDGRPIKIEGNTAHPFSLGSTDLFAQASLLDLYDPDRSTGVLQDGAESSWSDFLEFWRSFHPQYVRSRGEGLALLHEPFASPTLARLQRDFATIFPNAIRAVYEPVSDEQILSGLRMATGRELAPLLRMDKVRRVVSFDSDFLGLESHRIRNAGGFASGRRVTSVHDEMNRLYCIESAFTLTGAMADHRAAVQAGRIPSYVLELARALVEQGLEIGLDPGPCQSLFGDAPRLIARDLMAHRAESLILAGRRQPAAMHALVLAMNIALGSIDNTLELRRLRDCSPSNLASLVRLSEAMDRGEIDALFILGGNPVYNAPGDMDFAARLARVRHPIHFSTHSDETSERVQWHLPMAHFLEQWGDARSLDGTRSVIQPMIQPLYGGRGMAEMMELINRAQERSGYELVRDTWRALWPVSKFEKEWRRVLRSGALADPTPADPAAPLDRRALETAARDLETASVPSAGSMELVFAPCYSVYDGRYANNGWLQECPDPITKITWDNVAQIAPASAGAIGMASGDVAEISVSGRTLRLPVWIVPGTAENSIIVTLGYGRTRAGRIGDGTGVNVYPLRASGSMHRIPGITLTAVEGRYIPARTQEHDDLHGRPLVRSATLQHYRRHPHFAAELAEHPPLKNLWSEHGYDSGYQWGMVIDLNTCTGCNACVIACQSENNIPIVGREGVRRGREMHWMRLDRYQNEDGIVFQPVACQHCENAPCEQVCPVAATVHDSEGLNLMTYNRCVGTRYCSNNCPYKVRRFNFFDYIKDMPETVKMVQNPDVTVRSRGVMEKCTYCLQRIRRAKSAAEAGNRELRDGELETACQAACPANAIVFGNLRDPESRVSRLKENERCYEMLAELNTRPRTSYLAGLRNPNPDLEGDL